MAPLTKAEVKGGQIHLFLMHQASYRVGLSHQWLLGRELPGVLRTQSDLIPAFQFRLCQHQPLMILSNSLL